MGIAQASDAGPVLHLLQEVEREGVREYELQ